MANFVSPGVYVIEKDMSDYSTSINPSVVGVVGFADQGPTNNATLITSQEQLVQTFGNPVEDIPGQGLEGSLEMLETTNSLYFVRAAGSGAKDASATVQLGGCPSFLVSAVNGGVTLDDAVTGSSIYISLQVAIDGVNLFNTPKEFNIPSGTVAGTGSNNAQGAALKKIIGGSLDGANVGAYFNATSLNSGYITAGFAGSSVVLTASAWSDPDRTAPWQILQPIGASGEVQGSGATVSVTGVSILQTGTSSLAYSVQSLYPGRGYNEGSKSDGTTSGYSAQVLRTGGENVNFQISKDGAATESFKISLLASGAFAEDVINTGSTDLKSQYIKGYFVAEDADVGVTALTDFISTLNTSFTANEFDGTPSGGALIPVNPRFVKPIEGTYALAGGTNGTQDDTAVIGNVAEKTGIYALDDDTLNVSLGIVPGNSDENVQNNLITLAENTQGFLAVVSPPEGLNTVQQAIDWTNGQSDERTAAITSNYAAIYWPWVQTYDTFAARDRYYDPAIYAVRQMAYTDEVGDPWFAPAGVVRGRLTKPTNVEVSVNQGDRDSMYSGGNVVNPIVNFPQNGIIIFGQRTAQRNPTALDRVNVRRLMIQVRKILLASTRRFVFEPNDSTTWEKITNVVNPMLDDIRRRRGLVDFKVVCDETTNTAVRVDRNELWCKVLMKPTKTAEIIVFELNLTNQAASLTGTNT
jgi:phage tail sheath protein FI